MRDNVSNFIPIKRKIEILKSIKDELNKWFTGSFSDEEKDELRTEINRNIIVVRNLVIEAGVLQRITISPPPAVGGMVCSKYGSI